MKRPFLPLLVTMLTLTVSPVAHAWNRIGHMTVAGIAYDQLTDQEKQKLVAILKHLPNSQQMIDDFGDTPPTDRELVMAAATWPDLIKSDTVHYVDNGSNEHGPLKAVTASGGETNGKVPMHKGWHFIDISYNLDTKTDGKAPDGIVNIVEVLTVIDQALRNPPPNPNNADQAYQIAWLLHLVGDIHQPLHCAQGVDTQNPAPEGDRGGNNIVTHDPITHEKELHAFWDDLLGKDTIPPRNRPNGAAGASGGRTGNHRIRLDLDAVKASQVISAVERASGAANAGNAGNPDNQFQKWADASHKLAVDDAYGELQIRVVPDEHSEKDVDTVTIDQDYHDMASRIAVKQVDLAGHRLAALLKVYLKDN